MMDFFIGVGLILCLLTMVVFYRIIFGPTFFDRLIGINVIGTKTLVLLVLIGFIYNRVEMLVDISLVYALLNFIGMLTLAKYLQRPDASKDSV